MIDSYKYAPFSVRGSYFRENTLVGNMTWKDLDVLDHLINKYKKNNIIAYEIGTWTGMSACCIGSAIKDCGGKLVTIDNFKGSNDDQGNLLKEVDVKSIFLRNIKNFELEDVVTLKEGNSNDIVLDVPDESIDFMFIDGDHRYTQIKKDLDNWFPKIKKGGLLCGHDYENTKYDESLIEKDGAVHHGVIKAVNEKFGLANILLYADIKKRSLESSIWQYEKNGSCN